MARKNPYYVELRRYLAEVSSGVKPLKLDGLAKRVSQALQHGVPSLDICESFEKYSETTSRYTDTKTPIIYPPQKMPFVPNAVRGRPFAIRSILR